MDPHLRALAECYRVADAGTGESAPVAARLRELVALYRLRERASGLVDAAMDAAAAWAVFDSDHIDWSSMTPELRQAFEAAFPTKNIEGIAQMSPEALDGLTTTWRGKLYEVVVANRLNAGEWVGGLHLEPGQTATLAELANQPGWDIAIHDESGDVLQELSLKATASAGYIREALDRYPDIQVLTTSDVGSALSDVGDSVTIDDAMTVSQLAEQVEAPLGHLHDSLPEELLEELAPYLVFAYIAIQEAVWCARGKKTVGAALSSGANRGTKSLAAIGVGAAAHLVSPALAAPASFMTRLGLERMADARGAAGAVREWRIRIEALAT